MSKCHASRKAGVSCLGKEVDVLSIGCATIVIKLWYGRIYIYKYNAANFVAGKLSSQFSGLYGAYDGQAL